MKTKHLIECVLAGVMAMWLTLKDPNVPALPKRATDSNQIELNAVGDSNMVAFYKRVEDLEGQLEEQELLTEQIQHLVREK